MGVSNRGVSSFVFIATGTATVLQFRSLDTSACCWGAAIDVSTVILAGAIPAESHPVRIGDHDEDTVPDLMVKFSRPALSAFLEGTTGQVTLTLSGALGDGTSFEGSATLKVIHPPSDPS